LTLGLRSKLFFVSLALIVAAGFAAYLRLRSELVSVAGDGAATDVLERAIGPWLLLAVLVAFVIAAIGAELALRPARVLTHMARRLAADDFAARSRLTTGDDFGELGRALDQLALHLSNSLSELAEERDLLRGILWGMQEGVILLDASGRIALLNPALREMLLLGVDAQGKTLLEAIRHVELKQLLDEARGSSEPLNAEIEVGGIKPRRLLVRVAHVPGDDAQRFAVFVDVTEVRRLESMRRDFVANVSHELRTPVTAIRSAAETLQSAVADDPQVVPQFIGIIERNAARLQDLVEDVLDLSHIESHRLRLNMEAIDLRSAYAQVLSSFRDRASKKQVALSSEVPLDLPLVRADRRALEHVLTNLVDNAIKYCQGGSRVRLGATEVDGDVRLVVADDGPGIEARHLPRIFERFYRVDAGRSREIGGTGLGLSIVKHLVEAMGGVVQVESSAGAGTAFSFTLHRGESEGQQAVA
jgi:two-component system phosphate regulon sensor histidine kinase PhoR